MMMMVTVMMMMMKMRILMKMITIVIIFRSALNCFFRTGPIPWTLVLMCWRVFY